jgi:hypothetical protein
MTELGLNWYYRIKTSRSERRKNGKMEWKTVWGDRLCRQDIGTKRT